MTVVIVVSTLSIIVGVTFLVTGAGAEGILGVLVVTPLRLTLNDVGTPANFRAPTFLEDIDPGDNISIGGRTIGGSGVSIRGFSIPGPFGGP